MAEKKKTKHKTKTSAKAKPVAKAKTTPKVKPRVKVPEIKDLTIRVCVGTGGLAAGSQEVIDAFYSELNSRGLKAAVEKKCVKKTGCRGFCAKDVLVDVILNGNISTYQYVKPEKVERIVQEHIINGHPVEEWLVGPEYHTFHEKQTKILLKQCGQIDPEDIDAYIAIGGYEGAKKALSLTTYEVIEEVKRSGLRGRGGAGFLTGLKWEFCSMSKNFPKYIICNADEGDPGAFMDRSIIEGNPHSVIEGMIIGGYAIGANTGYIYIRAEYPLAVQRLKIAIEQATKKGFLGKNIFKSGFDFEISIKEGAGAFICGEETALIASIEGKRECPAQNLHSL
jgi:NADH-quinone oxidoreductase subunit F